MDRLGIGVVGSAGVIGQKHADEVATMTRIKAGARQGQGPSGLVGAQQNLNMSKT